MKFERRDFLKLSGAGLAVGTAAGSSACVESGSVEQASSREFNAPYKREKLRRIAFPIGGIGAGMICLEGTGALSHFSLRNHPDIFHEPCTFAAISVKGFERGSKILEGPVPEWKIFGSRGTGNGAAGTSFGFPRFAEAEFDARCPFATVRLTDPDIPMAVSMTGWSPFLPGNADDSSLPVGAIEYRFKNQGNESLEAVFSYSAKNFMAEGREGHSIKPFEGGFLLWQEGSEESPQMEGGFAAFVEDESVVVDHCWFRGGWWDPLTMAWHTIEKAATHERPPVEGTAPGASLFVPFTLGPGEEKVIALKFTWHVPKTNLRIGGGEPSGDGCQEGNCCPERPYHVPWYAGRFGTIEEVAGYWRENGTRLREESSRFSEAFYDTTLPSEVVEAIAANLTILKSPTVRRQCDGKLWCYEGCTDNSGCCHGSCTHVWNYAQAIPHLFPDLERSLRQTEFNESQNEAGHQTFRAALPIRPVGHDFHSASDGQLGGIMKVHREWRISGDNDWLKAFWPQVRQSLDYCITTWDPREKGVLEEPHHNTYDIEFWGPDGMCTSFYLGALAAAVRMGEALGDDVSRYESLLEKGRQYMEEELFDGEYFFQKVVWKGLNAASPVELSEDSWTSDYSPEAVELLEQEGPKYQYGTGCLSDGILGFWIARMCGLGEIIDAGKVKANLNAIHKYNLKKDLSDHPNPQRPSYALGGEGGLLLCTWPKGGELSLPFVYSNEVWTGIEYQVASHLMIEGMVEEGLEIVRLCRQRYDGSIRNPFNEYECGHWYARALASYGLIQGLTGLRYDAVEKTLYLDSQVGADFRAFLAVEGGYATAGLKGGKPFLEVRSGTIDVSRVVVSGEEMALSPADVKV
ncbi:MAG: hypothetical protein JSU96_13560 [Acidobacteriota bacterium]|nr:MAG: hypothetical protein JSU96_13560 [Acidobacteriota bacterium]